MKFRRPSGPSLPPSLSSPSRAGVRISLLAAALLLAGCSTALPTGSTQAAIYGVLYGHVIGPTGRSGVTIQGRVYSDSADAAAFSSTTGYLGGMPPIVPDSTGNGNNNTTIFYFNQHLRAANTATVWLSVLAQGQATTSVVYSTDTAFAIRMRVDSIGGVQGHDSVAVYLTLP